MFFFPVSHLFCAFSFPFSSLPANLHSTPPLPRQFSSQNPLFLRSQNYCFSRVEESLSAGAACWEGSGLQESRHTGENTELDGIHWTSVDPELLQSGFWVKFLFWSGEFQEKCRRISQRISIANFDSESFGLVFPRFRLPPKIHAPNSRPNLSAFLFNFTLSRTQNLFTPIFCLGGRPTSALIFSPWFHAPFRFKKPSKAANPLGD